MASHSDVDEIICFVPNGIDASGCTGHVFVGPIGEVVEWTILEIMQLCLKRGHGN
jgi:hypothetical protein